MSQQLFRFPSQATVASELTKSKLYERGHISRKVRDLLVVQVKKITWAYKLAPETINVPTRGAIQEIQIFDIELKTAELDDEVLRAIDRAIPLPIIFQLHHGQRTCMVATFKRPNEAEAGRWVIDGYFASPWQPTDAERQPLPIALDLHSLYEQLLRTLLPHPARPGESLAEQLERLAQLRSRQGEYRKLEAILHREKQFNRKVALNVQLRELKTEIDQLSA